MLQECILFASDFAQQPHHFGGKAAALARLQQAALPIPSWFVVSTEAFTWSLDEAQRSALNEARGVDEIQGIVQHVRINSELEQQLQSAYQHICPEGGWVAVRSSASDEDGAEHSFAGQLDSFLFVSPEQLADKVLAVWRSGFGERVLAYRQENNLALLPQAPAVLVQRMVNSEVSGVAFGADPVSGRRQLAVVSAVYGLGSALVSGEADADSFFVDRQGDIIESSIAMKTSAHVMDTSASEGVSSQPIAVEKASVASLQDSQIRAIAELVRHCGQFFERPQDIEWAIEDEQLYLLQSRPITSLAAVADPDGILGIWDNSNIVESYGGVTTPLTFSFALYAYEGVYRELCRILGFSKRKLQDYDTVFKHMLGLIKGRIYYNLLSWYQLLAALPGFKANRSFMEQMMGVSEGIPDEALGLEQALSWRAKLRDNLDLAVSLAKLIWSALTLPLSIRSFYRRLDQALAEPDPPLAEMRPDELVSHYHDLERKLLNSWDAPLVNDFFAMIFYGVLRSLCERWCDDETGSLQNDLVAAEGGMISAEPAKRVSEMALLASGNAHLVKALLTGSASEIAQQLEQHPDLQAQIDSYLDNFGDRCLEELKLESPTLHDDPLLLLRSVGRLAQHPQRLQRQGTAQSNLRAKAEERAYRSIAQPWQRWLFSWVLRQARARVRDRENLRFERTRLFGRVRRLFLELGRRYYALGILSDVRNIFYLTIHEAVGYVEGVSSSTKLNALAMLRREEFAAYRQETAPADRFETRGIVYQGHDFSAKSVPLSTIEGDTLQGVGCCPGVVRGIVRVITDPREARLEVGEILVAERTDPGWIMLFPAAAGVLVERGSLLSHSAIVARELSIPAIVSLTGITRWLKDGDEVEFDGSSGVVRKVNQADGQ